MQQAISYRDRNGFIIVKDGTAYRFVAHAYAKQYDHLLGSGLYQRLAEEKLLIPHTENILSAEEKISYYKILLPEFIQCMSFPGEWSAGQWKEVVLSYLKINSIAVEYGMILKDGTPFNFTFHKGRCVFFDTLSFDFYEDGQPWIAYRQFSESMFGPLALIFFNSVQWAALMTLSINGWDLSFISGNLPKRTYLRINIFLHIHLHSKYRKSNQKNLLKQSSFNKQKLILLWKMMARSINQWKVAEQSKEWSSYYDTDIESDLYIEDKTAVITRWLRDCHPERVIDIGANTGKFSLLSSLFAKEVVAVELDHDCIDQLFRTIKEKGITNITTIVSDITQPTPGVGWNNEERLPLLKRIHGDMLLSLALIHHLCISKNIPPAFIAQLFAGITDKYAVVEFVPKSDPKIQQMLANREDIFDDYSEEQFIHCFNEYFVLEEVHVCVSSKRKLFLWVKK